MKKLLLAGAVAGLLLTWSMNAKAQSSNKSSHAHHHLNANNYAPNGVMGSHMHEKGKFMVSYRFMRMDMEGNQIGKSNVTPETIATTIPNQFFGTPGQPPTLRVVPTQMTTDMHMVGAMYAPTDNVTLMAMGTYLDREMDHVTLQGGAGTTQLGTFTTRSRGFGDTKIGGLIRLYDDATHHLHANAMVSLPTGSITKRDTVLAPTGATPTLRLPYAMQLGSGTFDLMPGITYTGQKNQYGWGAQYVATLRAGRNGEDYSLGNKHQFTTWGSYAIKPTVSVSARITAESEGTIDGIDSQIVAPVTTADPDNYGGERIAASLGLNTVIPNGVLQGHRFSMEGTIPFYQDLNGPQLERDYAVTLGWSKSF